MPFLKVNKNPLPVGTKYIFTHNREYGMLCDGYHTYNIYIRKDKQEMCLSFQTANHCHCGFVIVLTVLQQPSACKQQES